MKSLGPYNISGSFENSQCLIFPSVTSTLLTSEQKSNVNQLKATSTTCHYFIEGR